jgi:TrmH family RNA methyltransferase
MNSQIRFVLCNATHPGNIGAAARAMKTMGFSELVLVNPSHYPSAEADARATGALDVLTNARVVEDLAAAVADCSLVIATSARHRSANRVEVELRSAAGDIVRSSTTSKVAIVFGTERAGLTNAELDLCQQLVCIPSNPDFSSLNLAAAVQLIAYELRCAQDIAVAPEKPADFPPATSQNMEFFYAHLRAVLIDSGFLEPEKPRQLMRRLRLVFDRAQLDALELNILRGILSAVAPTPHAERHDVDNSDDADTPS